MSFLSGENNLEFNLSRNSYVRDWCPQCHWAASEGETEQALCHKAAEPGIVREGIVHVFWHQTVIPLGKLHQHEPKGNDCPASGVDLWLCTIGDVTTATVGPLGAPRSVSTWERKGGFSWNSATFCASDFHSSPCSTPPNGLLLLDAGIVID